MPIKLTPWNLCLGLLNKKDQVLQELIDNDIDVCCMQETELEPDLPTNILSSSDFVFEPEKSLIKKRVGLYIRKITPYTRRIDLEEHNCHVIIIDVNVECKYHIIALYRSFKPPDQLSPIYYFRKQMRIVESKTITNTVIPSRGGLEG
jgi:exonuclease III